MTLELFGHPFSSYTWKALIPLYENDTQFTFREIGPDHPDNVAEWSKRWPIQKFPVLIDGDTQVMEATSIIEYLDAVHPGPVRFLPDDPAAAREVRMYDRIFDNYVMNVMTNVVVARIRNPENPDPVIVEETNKKLDTVYGWLNERMEGCEWVCGDSFTMADCAAAPSLFYADWIRPNDGRFPALAEYRARLLARPSVAKAVDGGRYFRVNFPGGAPDRD